MKTSLRGFTMFFAVLVASLALAIGLAIYDITERQLVLSNVTAQSQSAIYAADTGAECALYWDAKYVGSTAAFATSSPPLGAPSGSHLWCDTQDISTLESVVDTASAATTTFSLSLAPPGAASPTSYPCVTVEVTKFVYAGNPHTAVYSFGHNTCNTGSLNFTERELKVSY